MMAAGNHQGGVKLQAFEKTPTSTLTWPRGRSVGRRMQCGYERRLRWCWCCWWKVPKRQAQTTALQHSRTEKDRLLCRRASPLPIILPLRPAVRTSRFAVPAWCPWSWHQTHQDGQLRLLENIQAHSCSNHSSPSIIVQSRAKSNFQRRSRILIFQRFFQKEQQFQIS